MTGVIRITNAIGRFFRDKSGSATVENVLWFPILFAVLGLTVDATLLMQRQSSFFIAARDASRQVALGQRTEDQVAAALEAQFEGIEGLEVVVTENNGFVNSRISAPFNSFTLFASPLAVGTLSANVAMWIENEESA